MLEEFQKLGEAKTMKYLSDEGMSQILKADTATTVYIDII